jgi:hypothetical protein
MQACRDFGCLKFEEKGLAEEFWLFLQRIFMWCVFARFVYVFDFHIATWSQHGGYDVLVDGFSVSSKCSLI